MLVKASEMDRPTFNTWKYLTKVAPHRIVKSLVDWPMDLWPHIRSPSFGPCSRVWRAHSFILLTWRSLQEPLALRSTYPPLATHPDLDWAIQHTKRIFTLTPKVKPISWNRLRDIPFIPSSGAGYGYVGKKCDLGNLDKAISRAVSLLYWWDESIQGTTPRPFRFRPGIAWLDLLNRPRSDMFGAQLSRIYFLKELLLHHSSPATRNCLNPWLLA